MNPLYHRALWGKAWPLQCLRGDLATAIGVDEFEQGFDLPTPRRHAFSKHHREGPGAFRVVHDGII